MQELLQLLIPSCRLRRIVARGPREDTEKHLSLFMDFEVTLLPILKPWLPRSYWPMKS